MKRGIRKSLCLVCRPDCCRGPRNLRQNKIQKKGEVSGRKRKGLSGNPKKRGIHRQGLREALSILPVGSKYFVSGEGKTEWSSGRKKSATRRVTG